MWSWERGDRELGLRTFSLKSCPLSKKIRSIELLTEAGHSCPDRFLYYVRL